MHDGFYFHIFSGAKKSTPGLTSTPQCMTPLPRRQSQLMKSLFTLQSPLNDSFLSPLLSSQGQNKKNSPSVPPGVIDGKPCRKRTRKVLNEIITKEIEGTGGSKKKHLSNPDPTHPGPTVEKQIVIGSDLEGQMSGLEIQNLIESGKGQRSPEAGQQNPGIGGENNNRKQELSSEQQTLIGKGEII